MKQQLFRLLTIALLVNLGGFAWAQSGTKTEEGYIDPAPTGDIAADEKAHMIAKNKWIKDNPEAYRNAGGDPADANIKTEEVLDRTPAALPFFNSNASYFLANVEAIPSEESDATLAELKNETENIKIDFPVKKTKLRFGEAGKISIITGPNRDIRGVETVMGKTAIWDFKNDNCESCSKKFELLRTTSGNQIVYVMQSEDEGSPFAYRLSFTKE